MTTLRIPATINGIKGLLTAREWDKAAIVADSDSDTEEITKVVPGLQFVQEVVSARAKNKVPHAVWLEQQLAKAQAQEEQILESLRNTELGDVGRFLLQQRREQQDMVLKDIDQTLGVDDGPRVIPELDR
ncbi:hypothetical protein [Rhodococcus opacus]|uniref:hypothetical protein n=1 Tax=Rhodococcus opacus TaxID=37919 RepID=UPI00155AFEC2|nr:hypothetical protein [Rhodococcus opacus]